MSQRSETIMRAALAQRDDLLALAWIRCRGCSLAEDAVQETFLTDGLQPAPDDDLSPDRVAVRRR